MANEVAEKKQSFSIVLSEKLDEISDALPKDFNKTRFVQNALALVNEKATELSKYSQAQIMQGLMRASYLDLDFQSKECYLIPYGSQLNYQTSYKGDMKLVKKYSRRPVLDIQSELIRKGDVFKKYNNNGDVSFTFEQAFPLGKEVVGAFAYIKYADGGTRLDVMSLEELETTRKQSKMANGGAWKNFTGEMYRKVVLRRLCKYIDLDFENAYQRTEFDSLMEIETDTKKIVENEIANEANKTEFQITEEGIEVIAKETQFK